MNSKYNEREYIDNKLTDQGMTVIDDIVLVDGWQFQIDRSVPTIVEELGKGKENPNIQMEITPTISADYVNATLNVKVTYDGELSEIRIKVNIEEIPTAVDGVYTIDKTIEENGTYTVAVKDKDGNYKIGSVKITDITEDMEIWNKADMEKFRDMVNSGRTFEGKTVRVMANIDLEGSESNQWVPIGIESTFAGTFEGNYHKINNLYVNSNKYQNLGLFTKIDEKAIVQNLVLENVNINSSYGSTTSSSAVGGMVGHSYGMIMNCGINEGIISGAQTSSYNGNDWGKTTNVGGICGFARNDIKNSYNKATIKGQSPREAKNYALVGGITGGICNNKEILNCYNQGSVTGDSNEGIIGGLVGKYYDSNTKMENSYNIGNVTGSGNTIYVAGIVGANGIQSSQPNGIILNSYCTTTSIYSYYYWNGSTRDNKSNDGKVEANALKTYASKLGEEFTNDVKNEDGTWKYNEGYPILKWQKNVK